MQTNKLYEVTKRIKVHTKPLVTYDIVLTGKFIRETKEWFIFDNFNVKKSVITSIKEKDDEETARKRLDNKTEYCYAVTCECLDKSDMILLEECYRNIDDAIAFIKARRDNPKQEHDNLFVWRGEFIYKIRPLKLSL